MLLSVMTNSSDIQTAVAKPSSKLTSISTCGKWKSFLGHAGLMQYIPSGVYFARVKVTGDNGKPTVKRASLETDVFTTAKDRLADKVKELRTPVLKADVGTVASGREKFEAETLNDGDLAELSKQYRLRCADRIFRSWPELQTLTADQITSDSMKDWAKKYAVKYAPQFFNNSLNVFRGILALSGLKHDDNPAYKVDRRGIPAKELKLPTLEQFKKMLHEVEHSGAGQSKDCANLVRFLAFTGSRICEARLATWKDVDFEKNFITVHCAKRRVGSSEKRTRNVPLIPAMKEFLLAAKAKLDPKHDDNICRVFECQKSLTRACKQAGCARLTHHSLRHLFATFCIEADIDIPTVSRWLGHSDGGALAMKVYGHLRDEHSQQMAQRVNFGTALAA